MRTSGGGGGAAKARKRFPLAVRVCDPPHTPQTQTAKRCPQVSALLGRIPSAVGYQPTLATDLGLLQERITTNQKGSITSVQVPSPPPPSPLSIYLSFVAPRSEPKPHYRPTSPGPETQILDAARIRVARDCPSLSFPVSLSPPSPRPLPLSLLFHVDIQQRPRRRRGQKLLGLSSPQKPLTLSCG